MPNARSFSANVKDLRSALHIINKVMVRNRDIPVLEHVLFHCVSNQVVSVTATNLRLWVTISLTQDSIPLSTDKFLIPFAALFRISKKTRGDHIEFLVTLPAEEAPVGLIVAEGEFFTKPDHEPGDFPKTPTFKAEGHFAMSGHQLKEGLRIVEESICYDDLRPAMTKIHAHSFNDALRFVTTDGHRLTAYDSNTSYQGPEFKLSKEISMLLRSIRFNKSSYAHFDVGKGRVSIDCGDLHIVSTFEASDRFPDYLSAIPNTERECSGALDVDNLKFRADLSLFFANRTTHQAKFTFEETMLTIFSEDLDDGSHSIQMMPIDFSGEKTIIGFNLKMLINMFKHCNGRASFSIFGPNRAALFFHYPKYGKETTYLLMPVMLNTYPL